MKDRTSFLLWSCLTTELFSAKREFGVSVMVIQVVEFSSGGSKLERVLPKNQHTLRKFLNFENWCDGEVSKSAYNLIFKNHRNLSQFSSLKNIDLVACFLFVKFFDNINL